MEASPEQDAKLISIAVVLASVFIYNSAGALDETAFSEMGILAHAAQSLQANSQAQWDPPALIWALRDFSLLLEDAAGGTISADDYLERCISEPDKGESRGLLRSYFSRRSLVPFVRPVSDEDKLRALNTLPLQDLRPEFVEQLDRLAELLRGVAQPKTIGGRAASGPVLAHLCHQAVAAVNAGAVPCVSDSFTFLLDCQLSAALQAARSAVDAEAERLGMLLPRPPDQLRLERPSPPETLGGYPSLALRFKSEIEEFCRAREGSVAKRNDGERKRWLREVMEKLNRTGEKLDAYVRFLQEAHLVIGAQEAHEAALLVFETCLEGTRAEGRQLREAVCCAEEAAAATRRRLESASADNDEIRAELEAALVSQSSSAALRSEEAQLAAEKRHSETLAAELSEATLERQAFRRQSELVACELAAWQEKENSACAEASSNADSFRFLEESEACALRSIQELRGALESHEAGERDRLSRVRTEMVGHVQEAQRRFVEVEAQVRSRLETETGEAEAARAKEARARSQEVEEGAAAARCRAEVSECRDAHAKHLAQLKRHHTEALMEKARLMREAHDLALTELHRTRERATESDRAKVRLEIENESHKRACESHKEDMQQLAKMRRYAEDLRERLAERDAVARTSSALLNDSRRRNVTLEDRLREVEASHAQDARSKDYRIAVLEVQLSAAKDG